MACDIGSTHTKVALLRNPKEETETETKGTKTNKQERRIPENNVIYISYRKYLPLEQQDGETLRALLSEIGQVLEQKAKGRTIEAWSFSGHGPSLIAIDRNGRAISGNRNPIHRTAPEIDRFRCGSSFYLPLARALWAGLDEEQRKSVASILPPSNYVSFLLTGRTVIPIPEHYEKFYWHSPNKDGHHRVHSPKTQDYHEMDSQFLHLLPELAPFCDTVGEIQAGALSDFGLPPASQGTPVFCPGVDFFVGEAGLSYCASTLLRNRTGTSEGFNLLLPEYTPEVMQSKLKQMTFPPGYFLNYHVISKGALLSYVREGSGELFGKLFGLWQSHRPRHPHPAEAPDISNTLYCASLERTQKNIMLQDILLNASPAELKRANQFAHTFASGSRPCSEFLQILERELHRSSFEQLGLYTLQLLVRYFIMHCETIYSLHRKFTGSIMEHEKETLLSGSQAYYPGWLAWKARHSGIAIHVPSICDAEFIGAAAICFHKLGYFPSIKLASKHLLRISQVYA
ncbi:hypothetical protein P0082_08355 [Candidatus Haliotispira prima]|uniref:Carbohydrate kinase FGGY N-terminal domain-containing protein n=1 Tax=Candidatus Haliotispira prima TaxID=3034016 RepID=A0ABY8MES8_9SPIO|nr:hypothetical protein P0082_08355 [Candidatus Haliotispira prima]